MAHTTNDSTASLRPAVRALMPRLRRDLDALLMSIAVAAAASFLTPIATPANMMIQQPAGYRFGDYWRLGLPLMAWFGVVAVSLVPHIW